MLGDTVLKQIARELRTELLDAVSATGGHLSAGLGVVELTVALHAVFDTPNDRIVWDVGHQSYPHKILTGRRGAMKTLRQIGGLSGFPSRAESEYDAFGTAHSSTAISAALGMAHTIRLNREDRRCVAVVGDGALSAGLAYEALNNAALDPGLRLLVILNDNGMSISPAVGGLHAHLGNILASRGMCRGGAGCGKALQSLSDPKGTQGEVGASPQATLFEALGLIYTGPVDGHDLDALVPMLRGLRDRQGVQLLHVVTRKGYGYLPAEHDPVSYHGPGKFDPKVGLKPAVASRPPSQTYTQVFSDWICDEAARDKRVVAITPAMREGSGLVEFQHRYPDRCFDVGIAEQHAVTLGGGFAAEGFRPVVAIYSTFLQRGYDQLIHDIAIQRLPVTFAIDRAGVVGADGPTHMGAFDMAYMRCVPNLIVMAPADENECRQMLHTALLHDGPAAVRYPRGTGPGLLPDAELAALPIGVGDLKRVTKAQRGSRIALLAFGSMVKPALVAAERIDATVANMRFVKPLDVELVQDLALTHDVLVTAEEGCIAGGAGSACLEALAKRHILCPFLQLGLADDFIPHGDPAGLLAAAGLDADGIEASIRRFVECLDTAAQGDAGIAAVMSSKTMAVSHTTPTVASAVRRGGLQ
ncbi:1-deoxy-D-xylulose-5-phosphate synthase [Mesorhizobium retamae]|uniref:1-deoxy-D-xylulose-5-phosphate synthase n=1 Tax=Mesorhizobium retamae TaxID=2912854 RepID=A0ABS9QNL7_9HYPH|nr:1-deoxy-D-xylulose-5-phosphate synthase [Mesorhizobium sp. IRAMC:0171]MCG7508438.1 1-deoxy-D-xylulose-5-phosphate synthase [Mesorhizobium sp. IRAMC:0171]